MEYEVLGNISVESEKRECRKDILSEYQSIMARNKKRKGGKDNA